MAKQYRVREGDVTAVDTKTQLTTTRNNEKRNTWRMHKDNNEQPHNPRNNNKKFIHKRINTNIQGNKRQKHNKAHTYKQNQ